MARSEQAVVGPFELQEVREALAAGDYSRVLRDARSLANNVGDDADEAALLVARAHLRLDDASAAFEWLESRKNWFPNSRVIVEVLRGIAEHRIGRATGVRRLEQAYLDAVNDGDRAEAAYYRGWAAYRDRDLVVADRWLQAALDDARDILAARAHALLAYVEEAREDYVSSARSFRLALRAMRGSDEQDIGLFAAVVHNLAVYGAELPDAKLTELVAREYPALKSTNSIHILADVVQTAIHLGIGLECAGQVDQALDTMDEAARMASSSPALVACAEAAAADLLRVNGEHIAARRSLRRLADALHANDGPEIEQQMPFLEAACVVARLEPSRANEWLARYSALSKVDDGRWALVHDRRVEALELHARGLVEAAVGQPDKGIKRLSRALTLWTELGYMRRAAYAQMDLLTLGANADSSALSRFEREAPKHSLVAKGSSSLQMPASSRPRLSPALETMLAHLCAGKSVREIALESGRSEFTLRNHLKRMFKAYGVKSSAALVAAAMVSTVPPLVVRPRAAARDTRRTTSAAN